MFVFLCHVQANMRLSVWVLRTVVTHLTSMLHYRTTLSELCGVSEAKGRQEAGGGGEVKWCGYVQGEGRTEEGVDFPVCIQDTVEPLYNGHHWGLTFCPL